MQHSSNAKEQQPPGSTPPEAVYVASHETSCDGGGGAVGHPRVYLHLGDDGVVCPYCSRKFMLKSS